MESIRAEEFLQVPGGFANCLRSMWQAAQRGAELDFSEFGKDAKPLLHLDRSALDTLMHLHTVFHAETIRKAMSAARKVGIKAGKRPQTLSDAFLREVARWRQGAITVTQAAKNCEVPLSTFWVRAQKVSDEMVSLLCHEKADPCFGTQKEACEKGKEVSSSGRELLSQRALSRKGKGSFANKRNG